LLVSKQANAQAPSAPCVSALNAREIDDWYFLTDPIELLGFLGKKPRKVIFAGCF